MRPWMTIALRCSMFLATTAAAAPGFAQPLGTVITVPASADPLAAGSALLAAMGSIADASAAKPYLLKLEPGVYDLGRGGTLQGKLYVDVEGSGEGITILQNEGDPNIYGGAPVLEPLSHEEFRALTIRDRGTTRHLGPLVNGYGAFSFRFVTVDANGTRRVGLQLRGGGTFEHVTVNTPCVNGAVNLMNGAPTFKDSTIGSAGVRYSQDQWASYDPPMITLRETTVLGGIWIRSPASATVLVRGSTVTAPSGGTAIYVDAPDRPALVFDSIVDGPVSGNVKCAGVVNAGLDALSSTCQ
jgi:hypothetical protein